VLVRTAGARMSAAPGQIVVERSHALDLPGARRLAETMARRLRQEHGGTFEWEGDTLVFSRTGASGHVAVRDASVEVVVELGWLLRPLRSRIEREIVAFLDEQLAAPGDQAARPVTRRKASTRSSRSQGTSRSVRPK